MKCAKHITNNELLYTHTSQSNAIHINTFYSKEHVLHIDTHTHDKNNLECSYTWHEVIFTHIYVHCKGSTPLIISTGVYKRPTAGNIAGPGLKLAHLKLVYSRGGEDRLMDVLLVKTQKVFIELLVQKKGDGRSYSKTCGTL